jgi:D-alanyl-D-alanine carboxypeptidase (penicillin-binding protein 5/6)
MTKRFPVFLLVLCFIFISFKPVAADDLLEYEPVIGFQNENEVLPVSGKLPEIEAAAGIVMDMETGRILYEKNAYTRRSMASTTKIMTAILAIEKGKLEDTVTVSERAASIWGSDIGLKVGDKFTLKELLMGMLICSGNDAAIAVAEHIGGTLENFLELMNIRAIELGAKDTCFKSPHGLDAAGHYSTAYDLV